MIRRPPRSTLFPYPPLSRSSSRDRHDLPRVAGAAHDDGIEPSLELVHDVLDPPADYSRMGEPEISYCAQEERNAFAARSEEHTSELQSQSNLVCRLLLEKKK